MVCHLIYFQCVVCYVNFTCILAKLYTKLYQTVHHVSEWFHIEQNSCDTKNSSDIIIDRLTLHSLAPFQTNGIFHKATYNNVSMVYCIY